MLILMAVFRKIKRFNYVLLVYDVFPENMLAAKLSRKDSLLYRFTLKCFNWAYGVADEHIVIGRDMADVVSRKVKKSVPQKFISNWADVNFVTPQPKIKNKFIQEYKLQDKTVFLFAGNLGRVQGIDSMLQGIAKVKNKNAVFLFAGAGAMLATLRDYINADQDDRVLYLGEFPISEQNLFLNACDVAIVSLDKTMLGLGVPSKTYFNMAAGKPLLYIGDKDSEIGRVVKEEGIGWVVPPANSELLTLAIDKICESNDLELMSEISRNVVENKFSEHIILEQYKNYFAELLKAE